MYESHKGKIAKYNKLIESKTTANKSNNFYQNSHKSIILNKIEQYTLYKGSKSKKK